MRYTVTKQIVQILGELWQPGFTSAVQKVLTPADMKNLGDPTNRANVAAWVDKNSGDFSKVTDFRADFTITYPGDSLAPRDIIHEWSSEENAESFFDVMYGEGC